MHGNLLVSYHSMASVFSFLWLSNCYGIFVVVWNRTFAWIGFWDWNLSTEHWAEHTNTNKCLSMRFMFDEPEIYKLARIIDITAALSTGHCKASSACALMILSATNFHIWTNSKCVQCALCVCTLECQMSKEKDNKNNSVFLRDNKAKRNTHTCFV